MILRNGKLYLLLGISFVLQGCSDEKKARLANPASKYCIDVGGTHKMAKHENGGVYGICVFKDNRQCEEWALFRGECPVGGILPNHP